VHRVQPSALAIVARPPPPGAAHAKFPVSTTGLRSACWAGPEDWPEGSVQAQVAPTENLAALRSRRPPQGHARGTPSRTCPARGDSANAPPPATRSPVRPRQPHRGGTRGRCRFIGLSPARQTFFLQTNGNRDRPSRPHPGRLSEKRLKTSHRRHDPNVTVAPEFKSIPRSWTGGPHQNFQVTGSQPGDGRRRFSPSATDSSLK